MHFFLSCLVKVLLDVARLDISSQRNRTHRHSAGIRGLDADDLQMPSGELTTETQLPPPFGIWGEQRASIASLDCRAQMSRGTFMDFPNWNFLRFSFPMWDEPSYGSATLAVTYLCSCSFLTFTREQLAVAIG